VDAAGGGGYDQVFASASFSLGYDAEIENLVAQTDEPIDLRGNQFTQFIMGNASDNRLDGGGSSKGGPIGGIDYMAGGDGNDIYMISVATDDIEEVEGGGTADRVMARVSFALPTEYGEFEILTTSGGTGTASINLTGNQHAQEIIGNAGANRLEGRGGADSLRGLKGADTFVFATKLGADNIDTIVDFNPVDDRFLLSHFIFAAFDGRKGAILPGHLRVNKTGLAQDASDHIIYDSDDGRLFYDADGFGAGAAVQFATLTVGLTLTNADFVIS
jgi:Ca2+-binding RTX toxin-like protein